MPKNPRGLCFPAAFFFWLGLAVAVATCSIVFVHDTELVGRLERAPVPFSWLLGGLILVVPYVREFCHFHGSRPETETPTEPKQANDRQEKRIRGRRDIAVPAGRHFRVY